jgi:Ca-activated chloride channel family protein
MMAMMSMPMPQMAAPAPAPMGMPVADDFDIPTFYRHSRDEESDDAASLGAVYDLAESVASAPKGKADELGGLFGRQLASGLWDDAKLGADGDLRRLRATVAVLRTLVERGVDTTHALYGAPLRKALEAVVTAAAALAAQDAATCERALGAAWLLAMGPRTRAAVEAAIAAGAYPTLAAMAGDAARVRAWVLA